MFPYARILLLLSALGGLHTPTLPAQDTPGACEGPEYRRYDALLGSWQNVERAPAEDGSMEVVATGESHIHTEVGGCALVEHRTVYEGGRATARLLFLRAYDPVGKQWRQVMASSFPGFFTWAPETLPEGGARFTTTRILQGDPIRVRMTEEPDGADAFRRTFERSSDGGREWQIDVVVDYTRLGARANEAAREARDPEAALRAALQHYLDGHATGDGAYFQRVFHPQSRLFWIRDGALQTRTSADYIAGAPGAPAADEDQRQRRITLVDVTGTAAVAKVELEYPSARITDYFTLLRVDGEWRIMNKIFHVAMRREGAGR